MKRYGIVQARLALQVCLLPGLLAACDGLFDGFGKDDHQVAPPPKDQGREATRPGRPLAETLAAVEAAYRLGPDRRFLRAAGQLSSLATGGQPLDVKARFSDGTWVVHAAEREW